MAAALAEKGPEIKTLDRMLGSDIARIADSTGGKLHIPQGKRNPTSISYQGGEASLGFDNGGYGLYHSADFGNEESWSKIPTPAVLFRENEVVVVAPEESYRGGPLVHRTITLSEGRALVKDIPTDKDVALEPDVARAIEEAENYRTAAEDRAENAYRDRMKKSHRR